MQGHDFIESRADWEAKANAFRIRLADTIRSLETSGEIQQQAGQVIAEHFDVRRANFTLLQSDGDTAIVRYEYVSGMPSALGRHPIMNYGKMLAAADRIVTVENVANDSRVTAEDRAVYGDLNIATLVRVQLVTKSNIAGALTLADTQPRAWSNAEVKLIGEAAERVWAAVERAHAEAALHAANAQLLESDRRKNEFLAMLAHELRNPLAALQNANKLATMKMVDARGQHYLDIERRQTHTLTCLVDELLDVSRVTRGAITLKQEQVDLAAVVDRALEGVHSMLEENQHKTSINIAPGPIVVEGDPVRLEQILSNLLTNAAKYTDPGGHIALSIGERDGCAEICVKDTGIGIAPDAQKRIFSLFGQAEPGLDRSKGGLGVGLTIIKTLVELHGGSIDVFSAGPGQGAEFTVMLPLAMAEIASPAEPRRRARGTTGKRLLLVEDSPDVAETLALLLQEIGHEVTVVNEGLSALDKAEELAPDLVLLDIGLPGIDGYEVARQLRQNPGTCHLALVALTGYGQDADRELAEAAGFNAHFVKPVDFGVLRNFIEDVTGDSVE